MFYLISSLLFRPSLSSHFSFLLLSHTDGGGGAENAASAAIEIGFGAGGESDGECYMLEMVEIISKEMEME